MTRQEPARNGASILGHFATSRGAEVLALQASPILGAVLGGIALDLQSLVRLGLLAVGSLAVTAHVFVFNDWAEYEVDRRDPRRAETGLSHRGITRRQVARLAIALLVVANVAFIALGALSWLLGASIAALGFLYSRSAILGKRSPIVGSINHLVGGSIHFLLGYTVFHVLDARGVSISLFFGLVFAGGHLNHEVRDYEVDLPNRIRTTAVVFGRRRAFIASLCTFSVALALIVGLAARGLLPKLLLFTPAVWVLLVMSSMRELRHGLEFESAVRMQRRYRMLFALIGLAMLVG